MAFSLYCGNETTTFYDRTKNFKHVFSERRYSGHLATSRKTVEQGFDKRESLRKKERREVKEYHKMLQGAELCSIFALHCIHRNT